uniref:Centrin 3 n=1 Tax=Mus musculus TaxID=10090 RepID=A0A286YCV3_MOUSE
MRALGFDVKKADVLKILKDYDREATGKITFEDFNEVGVGYHAWFVFIGKKMSYREVVLVEQK